MQFVTSVNSHVRVCTACMYVNPIRPVADICENARESARTYD